MTNSAACRMYRAAILEQAPRVLSLMDRGTLSPTAGCCDRTYWAWKFVDFPRARFQEGLCTLSFLYSHKFENNPYFQSAKLLEWIGWGMRFWSAIQHNDGSFDEAYPFERSLAATAFTGSYIGEALGFLGDQAPKDALTAARQAMAKVGRWLVNNDETHGFLSNHQAAAAAALYHAYLATGETIFERRSRYFLEKILAAQSPEGWYNEYGGADPGYQTHGSFYLVRYWQLSHDEDVAESLSRSMRFLAPFVHADGSLGGEYASRNTQTYYPAAFEMFAPRDQAAAWIAQVMRSSVLNGGAAGLRCMDSYNYLPFLNNLVFAYRGCLDQARGTALPEEPSKEPGLLSFPQAGILRVRKARYDAYVGTAKGGVIKVFDRARRRLAYSDCGYIGRLRDGRVFSTQHQDPGRPIQVAPDRIEIHGSLFEVSRPSMRPFVFVAFRLFSLSAGRLAHVGRWLKRQLVRVLIYRKRPLDIRFTRTIEFDDCSVTVTDRIWGPDGRRADYLQWCENFTTIHMGSSRYFINNELEDGFTSDEAGSRLIQPGDIVRGLELRHKVVLDGASEESTQADPAGTSAGATSARPGVL